jgi:hypothetical protein
MRIIVTQKGNEVLRGSLPSITPIRIKEKEMTPNMNLMKVKIENFKSKDFYIQNRVKPKQINRSINIRGLDYSIFNTPIIKKEKKVNYPISSKEVINNLKSLADLIKNSSNLNKIKKESVSPIFLKKLGIFNKNKINTLQNLDRNNIFKS